QEMIGFYLDAAGQLKSQTALQPARVPASAFDTYWAQRANRPRCASWFLVRMRRATRRTSPLLSEYVGDVRRVLTQIEALPPVERAWTLLYVRGDQAQLQGLVPDAELVAALKNVGPDAIVAFLRRGLPTDDPDIRAGATYPGSMTGLVLGHAPELLRSSDADA